MAKRISIRTKLTVLLVFLITVVIGVITVTVYLSFSSRLDIQLEETSAAKMDAAAARIDSWHLVNVQTIKSLRNEALGYRDDIYSLGPSDRKSVV